MNKRSPKLCTNFKPISTMPHDISSLKQGCCYCQYYNDSNCQKSALDELEDE